MFFSLRNYKLHIDQVKSLQLNTDDYTRSMAGALAVLHWHTEVDGMDIEFVLGSSPTDHNAARRALDLRKIESLAPGASTYEYMTNNSANFKKHQITAHTTWKQLPSCFLQDLESSEAEKNKCRSHK